MSKAFLSGLGAFSDNVRATLNAQWSLRCATELGRRVRLYGPAHIRNDGTLLVRDRVRLWSTVAKLELSVGAGGTLEIGEKTLINYGTSIAATKLVSIGPSCHIGTHVMIIDNDFHYLDPMRRHEVPEGRPIVIGENVWIAARAMILPGVTIGDASAIAAGAVVVKDVPRRTLVAGVPARVIREI